MNKKQEIEVFKHLDTTKQNLRTIRDATYSVEGVSKHLRNAEIEILQAIHKIKMKRDGTDKCNDEIFNGKKKTLK